MEFRNFLTKQILNIVRHNRSSLNYHNLKTEMFFFQIGCFPSRPENKFHECPPILLECQKLNVNVNLICIDKEYENFLENTVVRDRINSYDFPVYVYDNYLEPDDYHTLVEFCHFISEFSCISMINEFTGTERPQFINPIHRTDYLYISPSSCQANMEDGIYQPTLKCIRTDKMLPDGSKVDITNFKWQTYWKDEELYELYDISDSRKLHHVEGIVNYKIKVEGFLYQKLLSYMEVKPGKMFPHCQLNYNKDYEYFHVLIEHLHHRMPNSGDFIHQILKEFRKSKYHNLKVFIQKKIYYLMLARLVFKVKGDTKLVNLYNGYLIFDTPEEISKNLAWLLEKQI